MLLGHSRAPCWIPACGFTQPHEYWADYAFRLRRVTPTTTPAPKRSIETEPGSGTVVNDPASEKVVVPVKPAFGVSPAVPGTVELVPIVSFDRKPVVLISEASNWKLPPGVSPRSARE